MNKPLNIGTETQWGTIQAIGFPGERYYWILKDDGSVAMMPASVVEPQPPELKVGPVKEKVLEAGWWAVWRTYHNKLVQMGVSNSAVHHYVKDINGRHQGVALDSSLLSATRSDLAVEIDGVKCWFVEDESGGYLYFLQAGGTEVTAYQSSAAPRWLRDYASKLNACVICEAQWEALREEK